MTTNWRRWYDVYLEELKKDILKKPGEYFYSVDAAPGVAEKMTTALMNGTANSSNAVKRTAKKLGIAPNYKEIAKFIKGEA